jgi:hypothetical protein
MNLETKITIYKFTPQLFTLTHEIGTPYFMGQILFSDYNANILPAEYFL